MAQRSGFLSLGAFLYPSGHHIAAWRHPDAKADAGIDFKPVSYTHLTLPTM